MKTRFKVSYQCLQLEENGKPVRAIIVTSNELVGQNCLQCLLFLETGHFVETIVTKMQFEMSKHNLVTLLEVEDERAPLIVAGGGLK